MSRMALWNMYNNTNSLNQHNPSPPEVQQEEALNLQQTLSPIPTARSPISIKRERDHSEMNEYHAPSAKRGSIRSNSDHIIRKSSIGINNNHHHHQHVNNNNISHVTPIKDGCKRSESPSPPQNSDNGSHHLQSPIRHHHNLKTSNGLDSLGITIFNGMQFKIVSKGKIDFYFFNRLILTYFYFSRKLIVW
jgi:hypothetical protein